jgi:23S rRNA (cytosine1962-C5)-methyltransferase
MSTAWLKPGREAAVTKGHPWIFSGAIDRIKLTSSESALGETIDVLDWQGNFLMRGAYSPASQIRIRKWTSDQDEAIDLDFFFRRLQRAQQLRKNLVQLTKTNAMRLVHAESDGLPGLIVDRYADTLVMQCLTAGIERWRTIIAELLVELTGCSKIYERSDADVRKLEGLEERVGSIYGDEPSGLIMIEDGESKFFVDIQQGQKTGFYLDQRWNRHLISEFTRNKKVLDCFSYTGGFTVTALLGGAEEVISIDSSASAVNLARKNIDLNSCGASKVKFLVGDAFRLLRELRDRRETFDIIILDPPKLAPTVAQAQRAARAYKDINLLALKLLRADGLLMTFSCSGGISEDLFYKIIAGAAKDAAVEGRILGRMHQSVDHPVALNFPEGSYLKGFIVAK